MTLTRLLVALVLGATGVIGCGGDDGGSGGGQSGGGGGGGSSLDEALGNVDPTEFGAVATSIDVREINRAGDFVEITLETPEGGFEGASVEDLDGSAAGAFKALYEDAGFQEDAAVTFRGGLVDTRTGRDLPNAKTGRYRLTAREARRIDWDNAIAIDWSQYRVFAGPALKGG